MFKTTPDGSAYELHGPDDAPVVALIHGLGLCRRLWDQHLAAFSEQYRVLIYDLYGHGDSARAASDASLALYSDQLARLLDHIGADRAAVVGFSIGGMINRRFALDYPARLSALAILNSPHDRGEQAQAAVEERALQVRDQGAFSTFDAALQRWFTPGFLASKSNAPTLVQEWRGLVEPESYAQAAWVLAHGVRELTGRRYDVPALVLTCENDSGSTPAMSLAISAEFDAAKVVVVPDLQHLGLMEAPDLFTGPVSTFLKESL